MPLTHPTFLVATLNILILVLLALVGYFTTNPLVILGLLMLQQIPVFDVTRERILDYGAEEPGNYDGGNAGFNASI